MKTIERILLEATDFQRIVSDDKSNLPEDYLIRKGYTAEVKQQDLEERILRFVISDNSVDRDRDTIEVGGWILDNFRSNPVVLWAHSHREPPIGRSPLVLINGDELVADAKFAPPEVNAFADMIFRLLVGNFLRATSVGFLPKEWSFDEERRGVNFLEQELLEFSIVNVPSNPNALIAASAEGIGLSPLGEWATKALDELYAKDGPGYLWFPMSAIERVLKIVEGEKLLISVPGDVDDGDAQIIADQLGLDVHRPDKDGDGSTFEAKERAVEPELVLPETHITDVGNCARCGEDHEEVEFARLADPGDFTHWAPCPTTDEPIMLSMAELDKGTVPRNVTNQPAPPDTAWSRPRLSDFTSEPFGDLTEAQRRRIAGHFGWAAVLPPEKFGDLKLPHHRASDGWIVFRGVTAAMGVLLGARGGVDVPDGDRRPIYNHLARHYRQFDKEPPEFRFIEAQVVRHFPELYEFDAETGELKETFIRTPATQPAESAEEGFDEFMAELFADDEAEKSEKDDGPGNVESMEELFADREGLAEAFREGLGPAIEEAVRMRSMHLTGRLPD